MVGGFAVACARRGREQGEREPGEHLLMGFWRKAGSVRGVLSLSLNCQEMVHWAVNR